MVLEGTYGTIKNQLAGGGSPGRRPRGSGGQQKQYPQRIPGSVSECGRAESTGYYAYTILQAQGSKAPEYSGGQLNMPPAWGWGGLVSGGPPSLLFPSYLNINHTQDLAASLTKIWGQHTIKGRVLLKPQL